MKMIKCDKCNNIVNFSDSETFNYYKKHYDLCNNCYEKMCSIYDKYNKEIKQVENKRKQEIEEFLKYWRNE